MTAVEPQEEEISLFALGTVMLRNRARILRWVIIGGAIAALTVIAKPSQYPAKLSFVPQGSDIARSGLASLAGQLGLAAPAGSPAQSPEFYVGLIKTDELLRPITHDTFVVAEMGGTRVAFTDLYKIKGNTPKNQEERAIIQLSKLVSVSVTRTTGVVQVSVLTKWPSVSLAIAMEVLRGINDFNLRTRQTQAATERKFVEAQLKLARGELREAENRLQAFLNANRMISPLLQFDRDRLQREIDHQQQIVTTLASSYEDVRIREVRDTPTITVIESPSVATIPQPRGRVTRGLLGMIVGFMFGALLALLSADMKRRNAAGDPDAREFLGAISDLKQRTFGRFRKKP